MQLQRALMTPVHLGEKKEIKEKKRMNILLYILAELCMQLRS
jgi:hypothetical protein